MVAGCQSDGCWSYGCWLLERGCRSDGCLVARVMVVGCQNYSALCHWFVLRKLLNVPKDWCKTALIRGDGLANEEDGAVKRAIRGDGGVGADSWFQMCQVCLSTVVSEAWRVHQEILQLEEKMRMIQEEVKRKIKDIGGGGMRCRSIRLETSGERVALAIRKFAVPEIEDILARNGTDEMDIDFDINSVGDDDPNDDNWMPSDNEEDAKIDLEEYQEIAFSNGDRNDSPEESTTASQRVPRTKKAVGGGGIGTQKRKRKSTKVNAPQFSSTVKANGKEEDIKSGGSRGRDRKQRKLRPKTGRVHPVKDKFPCSNCSCPPFDALEDLEAHQKLHDERKRANSKKDGPEKQNLDCDQCTFPARDALELETHIRRHHSAFSLSKIHKKYPCPLCPLKKAWTEMLTHLDSKHASPDDQDKINSFRDSYLKCDECDFRGTFPRQLTSHRNGKHAQLVNDADNLRKEDLQSCDECGVIFTSARDLQIHINSKHKRVNSFVCDECGGGFANEARLRDHKISHVKHLERDWICHVCGADYPRQYQLNRHVQKYHSQETGSSAINGEVEEPAKIYKCHHCDLTSPYNVVIRKHMQSHKQDGVHRCEQCGRCYMSAQGLRRHVRLNHNDDNEKVPCPHCQKQFPNREYMTKHVREYCKLKAIASASGTDK